MRTAYELGYNVITLKDCAATLSEEAHRNAVEYDFPMFSHPMSHEEFLKTLRPDTNAPAPEPAVATA